MSHGLKKIALSLPPTFDRVSLSLCSGRVRQLLPVTSKTSA
jgi:hypothetical protein